MIADATGKAKPFYTILYVQVLAAIAVAVALGHFWPAVAVDMKPLGDGFIKLIKMVIALAIFCTVVSGISGMSDMKKVSSVGGKALIYFEVVSTIALLIGFLAAHFVAPGAGFNVDPATLDAKAVAQYAGMAKEQNVVEFILNIIPNTVIDAFARGEILPVVLVSVLFGFVLSRLGDRARPVKDLIAELEQTYDVYYVLPRMTSHWNNPEVHRCWVELLGQKALRLEDPAAICELIASTIAVAEGKVDLEHLTNDLRAAGYSSELARAVRNALIEVGG